MMPKIGAKIMLFPGCPAVFKGEYSEWGDPVYESYIHESDYDPRPFSVLLERLKP